MALHGEIKVNTYAIWYWSAVRAEEHPDHNVYDCDLWEPEQDWLMDDKPRQQYKFQVKHKYEDGAVALAAKVLMEAQELIELPKKHPAHPLTQSTE